jgi:Holliday junction resolvase RusA-like endonuclease
LLELTVAGDPVPKGRPRLGAGRVYTPERTENAEQVITIRVRNALRGARPVSYPVGLAAEFFCATNRRADGDNLLKLVADAMIGLVYLDDSQIDEWFCRVHRGVGNADARTELLVWKLDAG